MSVRIGFTYQRTAANILGNATVASYILKESENKEGGETLLHTCKYT